jgi:hypothetical protein
MTGRLPILQIESQQVQVNSHFVNVGAPAFMNADALIARRSQVQIPPLQLEAMSEQRSTADDHPFAAL